MLEKNQDKLGRVGQNDAERPNLILHGRALLFHVGGRSTNNEAKPPSALLIAFAVRFRSGICYFFAAGFLPSS